MYKWNQESARLWLLRLATGQGIESLVTCVCNNPNHPMVAALRDNKLFLPWRLPPATTT